MCELIAGASIVVGCVAWLTNRRILKALAAVEHVALVVQKEDFLRPDTQSSESFRSELRSMYDALHSPILRCFMPGLVGYLNTCGDPSMEAVRCVGNSNRDKLPACPRMHHKFILISSSPHSSFMENDGSSVVWTGSFNFTQNATHSFENAVIIRDPQIVSGYYNEFAHIYALSESLDWTFDWVAPEYRIGT